MNMTTERLSDIIRGVTQDALDGAAKECVRNIPVRVLESMQHEPSAQIDQRTAFEMSCRIRSFIGRLHERTDMVARGLAIPEGGL